MANPNKTVGAWRAKVGVDPKTVAARNERIDKDPMIADMARFQAGQMTAEEFKQKWQ